MKTFCRIMTVISFAMITYLIVAFILAIMMTEGGWSYADHKIFFHVITSGSTLFVALSTTYELFHKNA